MSAAVQERQESGLGGLSPLSLNADPSPNSLNPTVSPLGLVPLASHLDAHSPFSHSPGVRHPSGASLHASASGATAFDESQLLQGFSCCGQSFDFHGLVAHNAECHGSNGVDGPDSTEDGADSVAVGSGRGTPGVRPAPAGSRRGSADHAMADAERPAALPGLRSDVDLYVTAADEERGADGDGDGAGMGRLAASMSDIPAADAHVVPDAPLSAHSPATSPSSLPQHPSPVPAEPQLAYSPAAGGVLGMTSAAEAVAALAYAHSAPSSASPAHATAPARYDHPHLEAHAHPGHAMGPPHPLAHPAYTPFADPAYGMDPATAHYAAHAEYAAQADYAAHAAAHAHAHYAAAAAAAAHHAYLPPPPPAWPAQPTAYAVYDTQTGRITSILPAGAHLAYAGAPAGAWPAPAGYAAPGGHVVAMHEILPTPPFSPSAQGARELAAAGAPGGGRGEGAVGGEPSDRQAPQPAAAAPPARPPSRQASHGAAPSRASPPRQPRASSGRPTSPPSRAPSAAGHKADPDARAGAHAEPGAAPNARKGGAAGAGSPAKRKGGAKGKTEPVEAAAATPAKPGAKRPRSGSPPRSHKKASRDARDEDEPAASGDEYEDSDAGELDSGDDGEWTGDHVSPSHRARGHGAPSGARRRLSGVEDGPGAEVRAAMPDTNTSISARYELTATGKVKREKKYVCAVEGCGKIYKNLGGLKYHKRNFHKITILRRCDRPDIEALFRCHHDGCGKKYTSAGGLKYHLAHGHAGSADE